MVDAVTDDGREIDRGRLVYRWDLDKTYLKTEFDTIRDLLRTAFEPASRKRTVPGASVLLRELRATGPAGIFILSGSPEQMRSVLEAKLRLDGIRWDQFTLKPSLRNLLRGRFRFLRDQISYKLSALMRARTSVDPDTDEILFGDDAEADAFVYSLYADISAGIVEPQSLVDVLERARLYPDDIPELVRLASRIPRRDAVRRIFIHLDRVSSPNHFFVFGRRVCPFYNYFQPALVLLEDGAIEPSAALRVGAEMVVSYAFSPDTLSASFFELSRRSYIGPSAARRILCARDSIVESTFSASAPVLRVFLDELERRFSELQEPLPVERVPINYTELFARDRARARAARLRATWRRG